jgi:hypothetical protein
MPKIRYGLPGKAAFGLLQLPVITPKPFKHLFEMQNV